MQAVQWERRVHAHERFPDNVTGLFQGAFHAHTLRSASGAIAHWLVRPGAWSMLAEEPASQFVGLPNITCDTAPLPSRSCALLTCGARSVGMVKTTQMSKEGRLPMKHSRGSASLQVRRWHLARTA